MVAMEADLTLIDRSERACYSFSSIKHLPASWRQQAFKKRDDLYCLGDEFRRDVEFIQKDIRETMPAGPFDLILCRNLVFTYFDEPLQRLLLDRIGGIAAQPGALVIGMHENLPAGQTQFEPWFAKLRIFRRIH